MIKSNKFDAIIALGCVVRGDTPHFDYVCAGTTQGIAHLNATTDTPVIYGLITTNNMEQAEDRAGGKLGNKGDECAITAIKMISMAKGQIPEWPNGADCKSAGLRLRWFESIFAHKNRDAEVAQLIEH